jgi:hypothetical protein
MTAIAHISETASVATAASKAAAAPGSIAVVGLSLAWYLHARSQPNRDVTSLAPATLPARPRRLEGAEGGAQ